MHQDQDPYKLYITNISARTNPDDLMDFFGKFGSIQNYRYFRQSEERITAAAIITYDSTVDVNEIIRQYHRTRFDGNTLLIRRILPGDRPAYERFMFSNELYLSLGYSVYEEGFNDNTITEYFSQYGPIRFCRTIIPHQSYLIDFEEMPHTDLAILGEPHFYRGRRIHLQKFIPPEELMDSRWRQLISKTSMKPLNISTFEKVHRLKHRLEALDFAQKIDLQLCRRCFEDKISRVKNEHTMLLDKCAKLRQKIQQLKEKNQSMKLMIERNQRRKQDLFIMCEQKLQAQRQLID